MNVRCKNGVLWRVFGVTQCLNDYRPLALIKFVKLWCSSGFCRAEKDMVTQTHELTHEHSQTRKQRGEILLKIFLIIGQKLRVAQKPFPLQRKQTNKKWVQVFPWPPFRPVRAIHSGITENMAARVSPYLRAVSVGGVYQICHLVSSAEGAAAEAEEEDGISAQRGHMRCVHPVTARKK